MGATTAAARLVKLLLDEMLPPAIAEQLRIREHDVVAVLECDGFAGTDDYTLFELAQLEQRAIVTENVSDFIGVEQTWREGGREHHGLIFALKYHQSAQAIVGRFVRVLDGFLQNHDTQDATSLVTWL